MNIVIVDDEPLIRQRLTETIAWSSIDCEIIGESENGIDAIDIIYELKPDIVITDIRMPGLSGLELIEKIKPEFPDIKFILLTGYTDFKYAQTAVKLGAFDFVLKPTDEEEILRIVDRAVNEIKKERKSISFIGDKNVYSHEDSELLKEMAFLNLIEGNQQSFVSDSKFKDILNDFNSRYIALCIEIDNFDWMDEKISCDTFTEIKHNIVSVISRSNFKYMKDSVCLIKQNTLVLFLLFNNSIPASKLNYSCFEIAKLISDYLKSIYNFTISIGVSRIFTNVSNIISAYDESARALEYKFYKGFNSIILISDVPLQKEISTTFYYSFYQSIMEKVLTRNESGLKNELSSLFESIISNKTINENYIKTLIIQLLNLILFNLKSKNMNVEDLSNDFEIEKNILRCNTLTEIKTKTAEFFNNLITFISSESNIAIPSSSISRLVEQVIIYVKANISKDISLNSAAQSVYINPAYLCRLVKKETGKNFTEIVLGFRIEKAKELLRDVKYKTYEVGEMVGFAYSRNFSAKFKQQVGVSPTEFRKIRS